MQKFKKNCAQQMVKQLAPVVVVVVVVAYCVVNRNIDNTTSSIYHEWIHQ
jgi:hypothetical protein